MISKGMDDDSAEKVRNLGKPNFLQLAECCTGALSAMKRGRCLIFKESHDHPGTSSQHQRSIGGTAPYTRSATYHSEAPGSS